MPESWDPSGSEITFGLSNAAGTIYTATLLPGDLSRKGRKWKFKDRGAKSGAGTRDGLMQVQIKFSQDGLWRIKVRAFDNLRAADDPTMTVSILVDSDYFESTATFQERSKGYLLKRLPNP